MYPLRYNVVLCFYLFIYLFYFLSRKQDNHIFQNVSSQNVQRYFVEKKKKKKIDKCHQFVVCWNCPELKVTSFIHIVDTVGVFVCLSVCLF